jgi:hypothetical protein
MGVGIQSDAYGGVPQHRGGDLGVDVLAEKQRGAGVAEVVEADRRQVGLLQERLERAVSEIRGVDDRARLRSEGQPARLSGFGWRGMGSSSAAPGEASRTTMRIRGRAPAWPAPRNPVHTTHPEHLLFDGALHVVVLERVA